METVLIKLSGESLAGNKEFGFDFEYINKICLEIKKLKDLGYRIGIVCGGGNFLRGRDTKDMERELADYAGMMATIMNSLALRDAFIKLGLKVANFSGLDVNVPMISSIDRSMAIKALDDDNIVIFGGGTGKPFFSTDTGASLRAIDINASLIIKLTNVDGVYDKDPNKYPDAKMYKKVTYQEVLDKKLEVMDLSSIEMCKDNNIQIIVMNIDLKDGLVRALEDEDIGTRVCMKL